MEKDTSREGKLAGFEFFLVVIGPIGFIYFLYLHITKSPLLKEMEQVKDVKIPRREHGMLVTSWMVVCLLFLAMVGGMSSTDQSYSYVPPPDNGVPSYEIISVEDASYGKTIRTTVRVQYKGGYIASHFFELIAKDVVKKITEKQKVNAIAVFFYDGQTADSYYYGKIIWAPNGDWSQASNSVTGSYWTHEYNHE